LIFFEGVPVQLEFYVSEIPFSTKETNTVEINQRGILGFGTARGITPSEDGFETSIDVNSVPIPAAVWLFGSGLLGLIGVARRKKA
jgi:hypothetical protein